MQMPEKSYMHAASSIPFTGKTLCDALDQSAARFPDREAFVFASKSKRQRITFKQLREDVVKLASGFVHLGLKPGERVGIWAKNCYEWVTSFYAMAYAKLVCVRIHAGYNDVFFEHLMNKTKSTALIIESGNQARVLLNAETGVADETNRCSVPKLSTLRTVINLGSESKSGMIRYEDVMNMEDEEDRKQVGKLRETVHPDDEMMMLSTSGSTGLPKVVVKSHRASLENAHVYGRHMAKILKTDIRFMAVNTFTHGGGELSTVAGVSHGYTVVVPDSESDTETLLSLIREESVTVASLTYSSLLDFLEFGKSDILDQSQLQYLITTGNQIPTETLQKARQQLNLNIYTVHGITETGFVTVNNNTEKFEKIGYPIDHFEIKIINDSGHIVPRGTVGELCTRSPYAMLRYEDDEEETKSTVDQCGWCHTGDMCKMEEDGCLDIMGRKKEIIIKGVDNIYPVEVDGVLARHPKVKQSKTIGVPDERFIEEVCACVCLEEGGEASVDELLQFLGKSLPELRVPKYVLFFDSFPSSPIGKVLPGDLKAKAIEKLGM
ncbi:medium-chain acyl-CoA ligase ACSF2, mitochondrial-like [Ptychodera flava]|uniref:medium-chain acyl-CoA ligase ACSF2, mitochondrial-like n=1 Tax=Ptychodera flava TaxID=63121 RepID=UPI00396A4D6A